MFHLAFRLCQLRLLKLPFSCFCMSEQMLTKPADLFMRSVSLCVVCCMWRQEQGGGCLTLFLSTLLLWDKVSHQTVELTGFNLECDQQIIGVLGLSPFPNSVGVVGTHSHSQLFLFLKHGCWGLELMSLCLQKKYSNSLNHLHLFQCQYHVVLIISFPGSHLK